MRTYEQILWSNLYERLENTGVNLSLNVTLFELMEISKNMNSSAPYREIGAIAYNSAKQFAEQSYWEEMY